MLRMASQSFTFFFTSDLHRATDHSQAQVWVPAPLALSSTGPQGISWAKPLRS